MVDRGVEGIFLACTEFPMLFKDVEVGVPLFDTTGLCVKAAVNFALRDGC